MVIQDSKCDLPLGSWKEACLFCVFGEKMLAVIEGDFLKYFQYLEANHSYNCGLPLFFPTDSHPQSLSDLFQTSYACASAHVILK